MLTELKPFHLYTNDKGETRQFINETQGIKAHVRWVPVSGHHRDTDRNGRPITWRSSRRAWNRFNPTTEKPA